MRKSRIDKAREANELARLELDTSIRKRKVAIVASYDATKTSVKRRQPSRETSGEGGVYGMRDRWKGCAIGRDLERNYSPAKGILHQFRMNVVGPLGKLQVNVKGDAGEESAGWFNGVWAKDCDFHDDMHFSTVLQNVVAAIIREGDMLSAFDDGVMGNTGKLLHWEADQIAPLSEAAVKKSQYPQATQDNGLLRDKEGRVLAYVCTGKRGLTVIDDIANATILPRGVGRLIKNPWRLNQGRGVPSIITSATNFLDMYEMLAKELQSAKKAATMAGYTKRANGVTDWDNPGDTPEFLPENEGKTAATVATESAGGGASSAQNYERLEGLTGGMWEYLDPGDEVEMLDTNRPNVQMLEFVESVLGFSGASLGMAKAYALLRADSSYTSFRGDMILTWAGAFIPMQKWLERSYADWVATKALAWGQQNNKIKPLPAGWERKISWQWPTMPSVDEAKESVAESQRLKNGSRDYSQILGPDWQNKMKALAEQLDFARDLGLPLSVFEQKSGGAAPSEATAAANGTDNDDENPKK